MYQLDLQQIQGLINGAIYAGYIQCAYKSKIQTEVIARKILIEFKKHPHLKAQELSNKIAAEVTNFIK